MKNTLLWALAFLAILGFLWYSEIRDEQIHKSADAYEKCVAKATGGRTPSEIYAETGEYPFCEE